MIKNLNCKIEALFWNVVNFDTGGCKSVICQVLILWLSEFDLYNSLLLSTNSNMENKYCYLGATIFSFLNAVQHGSVFLEFVIANYSFVYPKNIIAIGWITPENYTVNQNRMNIRKINHP